jgi:hypothetical protein
VALGVEPLFELFAERNKNEHRERMLSVDVSNIFFIAVYFVKNGDRLLKNKNFLEEKKKVF